MAMSAIALASCSEEEPVSVRQETNEAISFRSGMGTRATETTNANLDKIYVTAFETYTPTDTAKAKSVVPTLYFSDAEFDKGVDSYFTAAGGKQYKWLGKYDQLNFFAYSPSLDELGADITVKDDHSGLQLESYTPAESIADQVDFITANATGNKKDNEKTGVELTFDHRLSQIELQAKNENPAYTVQVVGMRIGRPQTTGSFDFNTNEWTWDDWHETGIWTSQCDTITLSATPQSIMGPSGNAMLIPQTLTPWSPAGDPDNVAREAYLSVLCRITLTDNGDVIYPYKERGDSRQYAWASVPLSGTWEQGKKYIYTLDFTNGAGNIDPDDPWPGDEIIGGDFKFTVQVNDWVDANSPISMEGVDFHQPDRNTK